MADVNLLDELTLALQKEQRKATYACGGTIPIDIASAGHLSPSTQRKVDKQIITTRPVTIRFGPDGAGQTLTLPINNEQDLAFLALLNTTQPAHLGLKGQNVYDEKYRKATQLDPSEFCTDFSPYEMGITDIINQALVPGVTSKLAVRAELYKLNVYSGPSGRFKAHVDTPRSDKQIGSLVVCLPSPFEGGNLAVRFHGSESSFDWSTSNSKGPSIQWAAFYSDCEHEVHEVTTGHRLTLTYNLYASRAPGLLTSKQLSMDPSSLPLCKLLQGMLSDANFLPKGHTLGVYLFHCYPHNNATLLSDLPFALKGIDMVLYESVRAAGLPFKLVPIADFDASDDDDCHEPDEDYSDDDMSDSDLTVEELEERDQLPDLKDRREIEAVYYDAFSATSVNQDYYEDYNRRTLLLNGGTPIRVGDVTWLTKPRWKELNEAYIAYGNQASMEATYTSAAMLITVPSFLERTAKGRGKGKSNLSEGTVAIVVLLL